jgi:hypothetical protein
VLFVIYTLLTSSVTVVNAVRTLGELIPKQTHFTEGIIFNDTGNPIELYTVGSFAVQDPIARPDGNDLRGYFDLLESQGVPLDVNLVTVPADGNMPSLCIKIRDNREVCKQYQRGDRLLMLKFSTPSGRTYITHIDRFAKSHFKEGWELRISDEREGRRNPEIALCLEELDDPNVTRRGSPQEDETALLLASLARGMRTLRLGPYDRRAYDRIVADKDPSCVPAEIFVRVYRTQNGEEQIVVRVIDAGAKIKSEHQEFDFPYAAKHIDELAAKITVSIRETIVAAYPIQARIDDVFGENDHVRLSVGSANGVYEKMELQLQTSAGRPIGAVRITHTWPTISLGQVELSETYDTSEDAIRSLRVKSKRTGT